MSRCLVCLRCRREVAHRLIGYPDGCRPAAKPAQPCACPGGPRPSWDGRVETYERATRGSISWPAGDPCSSWGAEQRHAAAQHARRAREALDD